MKGEGKVWDKIKEVAGKVNNVLKSTKIISKGAALAGQAFPEFQPVLGAVSAGASSLGYGKRGRHSRAMHGRGVMPPIGGIGHQPMVVLV